MANLRDTPSIEPSAKPTATTLDEEIKLRQLQLLEIQIAQAAKASEVQDATLWDIANKRAEKEERDGLALQARERQIKVHETMLRESLNQTAQEHKKQAECGHRNSRGEPDTGALRDYNSKLILICQICQKTWNEGNAGFPYFLINGLKHIGGFGVE